MYLAHINHETHRKQTLTEHSKTVSALCKKYGGGIDCPNLAELCGLLHDMGKAKQEFQKYLGIDDPEIRKLYHGKINHSTAGAKYIFEKYDKSTDTFERYTAQIIALAICSHHSGLTDCIDLDGQDIFSRRINPEKEIYFEESTREFETACTSRNELETLFRKSVDEVRAFNEKNQSRNDIKGDEITFTRGMLTRYLLSCVIDSDRFDSFCFEDGLVTKDVPDISRETWKKLENNLDEYLDNKPRIYDIDELRKEISSSCKAFGKKTGGIYRLNVPTGGGKTLSSLRYSLAHAAEWNKERIFYVIPFTTIIDQNAAVIREALREDDLILEHHSNLVYEDPIDKTEMGNTDFDEGKNYRLLTERWDSPIILTTTVQMLNTLFLDKTSSVRRMHNLANSIIIFDEVQAIPVKCLCMFNAALNFLSEICGTTIILCTATQPKLDMVKPPLRISNPADMVTVDFEKFRRTNVCDARLPNGYSAPDLAEFVLENLKDNDKILVILNTKTAVKNLYTQLSTKKISDFTSRNDFSLYYLSTNLCPAHRQKRLEIIRAELEKENQRMICVSTQLIEAGVDVSFDCVIRSAAGIDSIAQAAGRCNRHGKVQCRDVFIVNSSDEKLSGLKDIDSAKKSAEYVLSNYKKNPAEFTNDILSQKMINLYYQRYFNARENEMGYRITTDMITKKKMNIPPGDSLFSLLSINEKSLQAYNTNQKILVRHSPYYLCQAFSTAGKLFEVIDQNTTTVIVPYGEGMGIIRDLGTQSSNAEKLRLLKKAQHYSVNIYGDLEQLLNMGNISPIGDTGAYTLNTTSLCYDEEYGVISQNEADYLF
ncbi:MAG TPA: CRISPR-associated helicase Cas3' [Methanocorpusculum sp.]|nr:CRISPR-associated helicase Cas3' [Methanocorpusculum sp.]